MRARRCGKSAAPTSASMPTSAGSAPGPGTPCAAIRGRVRARRSFPAVLGAASPEGIFKSVRWGGNLKMLANARWSRKLRANTETKDARRLRQGSIRKGHPACGCVGVGFGGLTGQLRQLAFQVLRAMRRRLWVGPVFVRLVSFCEPRLKVGARPGRARGRARRYRCPGGGCGHHRGEPGVRGSSPLVIWNATVCQTKCWFLGTLELTAVGEKRV
jgi:hypothetical protein